jgi:hypothetical protein
MPVWPVQPGSAATLVLTPRHVTECGWIEMGRLDGRRPEREVGIRQSPVELGVFSYPEILPEFAMLFEQAPGVAYAME